MRVRRAFVLSRGKDWRSVAKLWALRAAIVLSLFGLMVGGGAPAATADSTCRQTKAFFYTTDTQVLVRTLAGNRSDCADYYISISPIVTRDRSSISSYRRRLARHHRFARLRHRRGARDVRVVCRSNAARSRGTRDRSAWRRRLVRRRRHGHLGRE